MQICEGQWPGSPMTCRRCGAPFVRSLQNVASVAGFSTLLIDVRYTSLVHGYLEESRRPEGKEGYISTNIEHTIAILLLLQSRVYYEVSFSPSCHVLLQECLRTVVDEEIQSSTVVGKHEADPDRCRTSVRFQSIRPNYWRHLFDIMGCWDKFIPQLLSIPSIMPLQTFWSGTPNQGW